MRVNYRNKPKNTKGKSGFIEKLAKVVSKGLGAASGSDDDDDKDSSKDKSGISKTGDAVVSIVKTYKSKKAAKSSKGTSRGA